MAESPVVRADVFAQWYDYGSGKPMSDRASCVLEAQRLGDTIQITNVSATPVAIGPGVAVLRFFESMTSDKPIAELNQFT